VKTVFTNGCFDVLHRGHIELLKFCRGLGEKVVVGLNSDASIRKLKGAARPINKEEDRAFILEAMVYVDEVILFDEETPQTLIEKVMPDIIVKGGDYNSDTVVGKDLAEIMIFEYLDGYSTTKTLQDISNR
jgi:D-beta-D-heptose 7-phosphate kinase/D-beta-D-heptose 1-phosphate adenosyltransferase